MHAWKGIALSSDIIRCLERECRDLGIEIRLHTEVTSPRITDGRLIGLELSDGTFQPCDAAVVATGRSDFPNQINNVLAFPGISGELSMSARAISMII